MLDELIRDGVKVNVAVDMQSAIVTAASIFVALVLALLVYGKLIR